jgi:cytochrome c556
MPSTTFPKIDFSKLPKLEMPEIDTDRVVETARDAAYIAVGLGVLAFQRANAARHDMTADFTDRYESGKTQVDDLRTRAQQRVTDLDDRFVALEAKLDEAVAALEAKLPEQAATVVGQAHDLVKAARRQLHDLVRKPG